MIYKAMVMTLGYCLVSFFVVLESVLFPLDGKRAKDIALDRNRRSLRELEDMFRRRAKAEMAADAVDA